MRHLSLGKHFTTLIENSYIVKKYTLGIKGTFGISTPPLVAVRRHFHKRYSSKTVPAFLPAVGGASWSLLPFSFSTVRRHTITKKHPFLYPQRDNARSKKAKKG